MATTYRQAVTQITNRLRTNWSTLPVHVDPNVTYQPEAGGFVDVRWASTAETQRSRGGPVAVFDGILTAEIYIHVPRNTGDGLAWQYADEIAALFRGKVLTDLEARSIRPQPVDPEPGDPYFIVALFITFELSTEHDTST